MAARKTIFITGGGRGIGKGLVEHFSKEHDVIYSLRKELTATVQNAKYVIFDVSNEESIQKAISTLDSKVDILINNAGVLPDYQTPALEADLEEISQTFDINTIGPLRVCRAIVPIMNPGGRIINISSGMGQLSDMGSGAIAYRLSKTALNALSKVLSNELKANDISVNTICPGWVKTDMGGANATHSVADTVGRIASFALDKNFPNGQFLRDGKVIPW